MNRRRSGTVLPLLAAVLLFVACGGGGGAVTPEAAKALDRISAEGIASHMATLADDRMQGRGTATEGYVMAAEYLLQQFEALGLEPAGDNGSYYQQVPLLATSLDAEQSSLTLIRDGKRSPLESAVDYVMDGDPFREQAEVTAPLVFVGTAPLDGRGYLVVLAGLMALMRRRRRRIAVR